MVASEKLQVTALISANCVLAKDISDLVTRRRTANCEARPTDAAGGLLKKLKWIVLVGLVVSICGYFILHRSVSCNEQDAKCSEHRDRQPALGSNVSSKSNQAQTIKNREELREDKDLGRLYRKSTNHWEYAHSVLALASNGDPNAQFYLFKSIDFCNENLKFYFTHKGRSLTIDEGLQYAVQRKLSLEIAQSVFEKCHEFSEHDIAELGNPSEWLAKASKAGQPIAQAVTAEKILSQTQQQAFVSNGATPDPSPEAAIQSSLSAKELLRAAVTSKDPEVLFRIGEAQSLLNPGSQTTDIDRYAWWLVACQRGFDCSARGDWIKATCIDLPACASSNNPSDHVRSLANDQWPEVQERAKEINDKLDASQWNELGLGS